jgi:hypothetical protein
VLPGKLLVTGGLDVAAGGAEAMAGALDDTGAGAGVGAVGSGFGDGVGAGVGTGESVVSGGGA